MDIRELARKLWEARRTASTIDPAGIALPGSIDEAYAVQWEIARLSGHPVVGFKIGSTSAEAQRLLGTDEPGSAPLLAPFVHASPATIAIAPAHMPQVEGEIAFRLRRALPPRAGLYCREEVAAAVDAVAGAVEIVGTRFSGGLKGKGRFLSTADGGVNIAVVTGAWHADWRSFDLPSLPVRMTINGKPHGAGTGARALGDPMNVLVWLANQQSRVGRGLCAGGVVSTGTCTGLDPVEPGDTVVAEFGPLGRVEIETRPVAPGA